MSSKKLVKIALTGAAGQIGYAALFRIASGELFGYDTHMILKLLEIPSKLEAVQGVAMELADCHFSLLDDIVITDDPNVAFDGVNWALLVGAKPRSKGMRRGDLIRENGPIFAKQGRAISRAASNVHVLVVGNPANTNCLIAASNADGVPMNRFSALTRLDENRAYFQLANKSGVSIRDISNVTIWGNHSSTQYPDAENARIDGIPAYEYISDHEWLRGDFIETVQKRGNAVLGARGYSSVASAANAMIGHMRSMITKTPDGCWFSAAVPSNGSYGVDEGLVSSFPLVSDGYMNYSIVPGLEMSDWARAKLNASLEELRKERETVSDLLNGLTAPAKKEVVTP